MDVDPALMDLAATELVRRTRAGEVSPGELVEAALARIAERDPALNAFSVVRADEARAEAREVPQGPLHGLPVAVKEELDVAGCVTTFGGRGNSTPAAADSEVVRRLREAGAVVVGKTRMPEFGQWPFTESEAGGTTRNPWDPSRTPGGSSGGTAVAVAAGMVPVAIGGDGGGSIRIPSACCGLFGLKPQRGRASTAPMPHLWWSLGVVGPLTRTVADSAMVNDVLRGTLPGDRWRAEEPVTDFATAAATAPGRLRVGVLTRGSSPLVTADASNVAAVHETAQLLADLGHDVRESDARLPDPTVPFVPQFFAGMGAEADAVEHPERLERRTRQTYALGRWASDAVVERAIRAGERLADRVDTRFFDGAGAVDVLLTPTLAQRPPEVGVVRGGTVRMALTSLPMIDFCALWNVTGHPAAAVPAGLGDDGLPHSVQLVGRRHDETTLLSLAAQLERARPWEMPAL
ncbi:amidase [Nocardioides marmoraquaticus]